MTIDELNIKVQAFDVLKELEIIIKTIEPEIIDSNTAQLYSGIKSTGESLGEYRPETVKYKKEKGQPYDRVTLKDEGDFYSGFYIQLRNGNFEVDSKDSKTDKLATKYSEDIFGLTTENMANITDDLITPKLTKKLQDIL